MDFFQAQDEARRNSALLVFYFVLAVLLIIGAVYLAVVLLAVGEAGDARGWWRPDLFLASLLGTSTLVGGGSLYKIAALAHGGGAAVAQSLNGRRVARETADPAERRLLNVVDEMAIASGVPVPAVYVLDEEQAINAFAAGTSSNEAVVAVTRGALARLSRDELQGVIGHEFSHILNGDMRLNLRLIGVLFGILLLSLLGRGLLRGSGRSRGKNAGGAVLFGLALVVIGYVGVFFGRLIKAAVSRQREFLADAAAVQFIRNPAGIAGALKKIAGIEGSRIAHPHAEEASHLFFGEGLGARFGGFSTHPPIEERIRRLDPSFNPDMKALASAPVPATAQRLEEFIVEPRAFAAGAGRVDAPHLAYAREVIASLPEELSASLHDPLRATGVVYGLLLAPDEAVRSAQLRMVEEQGGMQQRVAVATHAEWIHRSGPRLRLPLLDMALPALAQLAQGERERFLAMTRRLIEADRRLDLFEYTLRGILVRHLAPRAPRPRPRPSVRDVGAIRDDCALLLSVLAYSGNRGEAVQAAFGAAAGHAPLDGVLTLLPREAVNLAGLDAVLARLAALPPRFKRRLVEACAAAIASDQKVTVSEGELLRAVCETLEVPMPPLLPS